MNMNFLIKYTGVAVLSAVFLVQAQTMRVYPKTSFWADYVVSSLDSISFVDSVIDSMRVYSKIGPISNFALSGIDSVKFVASDNFKGTYGTLVDTRDNQVYKTVVIGTQTWMAQNLNFGTYISDGASSSVAQNGAQKFCYSNAELNCTADGGLYQWHTAMGFASSCATTSCSSQISTGNHQGICPLGWHVPKAIEWDTLQTYLGGSTVAGSKMKLNNTGYSIWDASTYNNGNASGFSSLPAGYRFNFGGFFNRGNVANFWEASESDASDSYDRYLLNGSSVLSYRYYGYGKVYGLSLRCVRD